MTDQAQAELTHIKADCIGLGQIVIMVTLMYRCPRTGMNVPLPFALEPASTDKAQEYESVSCPACARSHLISKSTGKLLSDKTYSTTTPEGPS